MEESRETSENTPDRLTGQKNRLKKQRKNFFENRKKSA